MFLRCSSRSARTWGLVMSSISIFMTISSVDLWDGIDSMPLNLHSCDWVGDPKINKRFAALTTISSILDNYIADCTNFQGSFLNNEPRCGYRQRIVGQNWNNVQPLFA